MPQATVPPKSANGAPSIPGLVGHAGGRNFRIRVWSCSSSDAFVPADNLSQT